MRGIIYLSSFVFCTMGVRIHAYLISSATYPVFIKSLKHFRSTKVQYQGRSGISRLLREEDAAENPAFPAGFLLPFPVNGE